MLRLRFFHRSHVSLRARGCYDMRSDMGVRTNQNAKATCFKIFSSEFNLAITNSHNDKCKSNGCYTGKKVAGIHSRASGRPTVRSIRALRFRGNSVITDGDIKLVLNMLRFLTHPYFSVYVLFMQNGPTSVGMGKITTLYAS